MRPTNGEIRVTPASAQASACANEKSSVMLQRMPSRSRRSAARIPSQVLASLISTRSRAIPSFSYSETMRRALSSEPSMSKDRRASTSVDTRPATCFRISRPNRTKSQSIAGEISPPARLIASSTSGRQRGSSAEVRSSDGFVVASCGFQRATASMSPESATTSECLRSDSSWDIAGCEMRGCDIAPSDYKT